MGNTYLYKTNSIIILNVFFNQSHWNLWNCTKMFKIIHCAPPVRLLSIKLYLRRLTYFPLFARRHWWMSQNWKSCVRSELINAPWPFWVGNTNHNGLHVIAPPGVDFINFLRPIRALRPTFEKLFRGVRRTLRRAPNFDRDISMICTLRPTFMKSTPGNILIFLKSLISLLHNQLKS